MGVQIHDTERVSATTEQHAHRQSTGIGLIYQGRQSFPVQDDGNYRNLNRPSASAPWWLTRFAETFASD